MRRVEATVSWIWVAVALLAFLAQFAPLLSSILALVGLR